MLLSNCKIGLIVQYNTTNEIGHIVDLSMNCSGEVIPVVKWVELERCNDVTVMNWKSVNDIKGKISSIHPSNIEPVRC